MSATATATATAPQSTAAPADPASPSTTTSADAATAAETPEHHSSNGTPGVSAATSDSSATTTTAAAAAEPAANEDGDGDGDAGDEIIDDAEMREMDALLKDLEANSEPDEPPLAAAAAAADDDAAAASATTSSTSSAAAASAPAVTSMTENLAALIENMKQLAGTRRRCVRLYGIAAADRPTEQEVLEFVAPALNVPVDTAGIKVVFPDERKDFVDVQVPPGVSLDNVTKELSGKQLRGKAVRIDLPGVDTLLFVGNLGPDFTDADLVEIFGKHGAIYRSFILRDESTGESLGYAMVDFEKQSCAAAAKASLASSLHKGRNLRVDWADCRDYRSMLAHILFIDRLPPDLVDDKRLRRILDGSPGLQDVIIALHSNTGQSRRFAFAIYDSHVNAQKARKKFSNYTIGSMQIRVSFANPSNSTLATAKSLKSIMNRVTVHAMANRGGPPIFPGMPGLQGHAPFALGRGVDLHRIPGVPGPAALGVVPPLPLGLSLPGVPAGRGLPPLGVAPSPPPHLQQLAMQHAVRKQQEQQRIQQQQIQQQQQRIVQEAQRQAAIRKQQEQIRMQQQAEERRLQQQALLLQQQQQQQAILQYQQYQAAYQSALQQAQVAAATAAYGGGYMPATGAAGGATPSGSAVMAPGAYGAYGTDPTAMYAAAAAATPTPLVGTAAHSAYGAYAPVVAPGVYGMAPPAPAATPDQRQHFGGQAGGRMTGKRPHDDGAGHFGGKRPRY